MASSVRSVREFEFLAEAPLAVVAPLFGAERERVWAEGWAPAFLWPEPAADCEGMVFTLDHGGRTAVWINTAYDCAAGSFQYVYVVPERFVTRIVIALTPKGERTGVRVRYERTALSEVAAPDVEAHAARDALAGPEWEAAINAWLARPENAAGATSEDHFAV